MDMKTVQQLQRDAKLAENELHSQIQEKCITAIVDILKSVGLNEPSICEKDILRIAGAWRSNIVDLIDTLVF